MAVNSFADKLVKKVFGSSSDIFLKKVKPTVDRINALELGGNTGFAERNPGR